MPQTGNPAASLGGSGFIRSFCLLWLAGVAMRLTILAIAPVIPLVHEELGMSETQIGLLIGLPLAIFAIAAVPGSALIARTGTTFALTTGMVIAALAGAARAAAIDVWTLYAAAIATGFGVAIMQPGLPTLVRERLPTRIALGTLAYSTGMTMGSTFAPLLTIPFVLPLVGGSWRLALVFWAVPALLIVPIFILLNPKDQGRRRQAIDDASRGRWWPDWKDPLIWLLGLAFGSNSSPYFAASAFLGDYLANQGKAHLLGPALGWLNASQVLTLVVLVPIADRLQQRAWPFFVFGPAMLAAFLGLIFLSSDFGIIVSAALIGVATAVTMAALLALPPLLSASGDVARTAAGMFTISYACAIIIPTISGALWDLTAKPWTTFVPQCICAVMLTVLGAMAARFRVPVDF